MFHFQCVKFARWIAKTRQILTFNCKNASNCCQIEIDEYSKYFSKITALFQLNDTIKLNHRQNNNKRTNCSFKDIIFFYWVCNIQTTKNVTQRQGILSIGKWWHFGRKCVFIFRFTNLLCIVVVLPFPGCSIFMFVWIESEIVECLSSLFFFILLWIFCSFRFDLMIVILRCLHLCPSSISLVLQFTDGEHQ